jgi:hypothetical protein
MFDMRLGTHSSGDVKPESDEETNGGGTNAGNNNEGKTVLRMAVEYGSPIDLVLKLVAR